jgi:hypothetical protein
VKSGISTIIYYVLIIDHNYYSEADRIKFKAILPANNAFVAVPTEEVTPANANEKPYPIYLGIFFSSIVFSLINLPYCEKK